MAKTKLPVWVDDVARPKSEEGPVRASDLVEVVKRNGEFREWGPIWGPILYWLSIKAAKTFKAAKTSRPRPLLWMGWISVGSVGGFALRYGWPFLFG
jgi:hypothetical protein